MVAIARGLMSDPDLLVMDEPFMGLAPRFVKQVLDTVLELKQLGKTVLLVSSPGDCRSGLCSSDR